MDSRPQDRVFSPSPEFLERKSRLEAAFTLSGPDRIPVAPIVMHYYPTRLKAISNREAMYEHERTALVWKEITLKHNWDAAVPFGSLLMAPAMEVMGITQFKWPGYGLSDNQPFQWVEGEYMRQDEYDELLSDPNGFTVRKLWPRVSKTLAPISEMAKMAPPPLPFLSNGYTLSAFIGGILSSPKIKEMLHKFLKLVDEHERFMKVVSDYTMDMMNNGFPLPFSAITFPAFDWISDCLRGMKGSMLDMYRCPDKLLAAIDMFTPMTIESSIMMAQQTGNKGVFIPMHRGAGGFMSDAQFKKFYWPCFRSLIYGLVEAGLTPIPLYEGDYTPRLEYLKELPEKKVVFHFDHVDRKKARDIVKGRFCFWGNIPASLLCTGTPKQVKDDVKELIELFGEGGGLIVDGNMGIPDEARFENVQAMTEAVLEY
ncbi:MAG: hypothetical protein N2745_03100 [Syntrophorhabdaceae bacterium]|nr:hypothetical protein [Syntrophorhabdaceae bacterium]